MLSLTAVGLLAVGLAVGLLGFKLFRVLLPVAGIVAGAVIGFTGFQGIFGTGVTSTTIAVLVAIVFALVLGILSYAFFNIALVILCGMAMSSLVTLLAVALGLSDTGFIVLLLSIAGFIGGVVLAGTAPFLGENLVTFVTGFLGAGFVLGGIFLLSGGVTIEEFREIGIIASVSKHVEQSLVWVFVWVAGAVLFRYAQLRTLAFEMFPESFSYHSVNKQP